MASQQTEIDNILNSIKKHLGITAENYISDERIKMMFQMTNGDFQQTCLMTLGYLIQTLKLQGLESRDEIRDYKEKIEYFQKMAKISEGCA